MKYSLLPPGEPNIFEAGVPNPGEPLKVGGAPNELCPKAGGDPNEGDDPKPLPKDETAGAA